MMKVAALVIAAIVQLSAVSAERRLRSEQRYLSAVDNTCLFCIVGMPNPDLILPTPGGETCLEAQKYAHTLSVDDAMCPTVLAAQALCCPTATTESTLSMSMSMSQSMSVPSCAPIYEIGKSDPEFSTLVSLVELAQLADVLQGPASFTLLAPPNFAFEALPVETVAFLTAPENLEALQGVLLYHLFGPATPSSAIPSGTIEVESKMGATISVTNTDGAITVNDATVITADIMACNGIIHIIDKVLIPPTPAPKPELSMSMSHSMSISTDVKCHFCMNGMPDPSLVLPTPDGETCQQASDYAHTLTVNDAMCPTVLTAEALCCPTGVTDAPVTAPNGVSVECSCTPTEYTFVVDASTDCSFDTVKGNPGIGSTFCFLGSTPVTRQVVEITSVQFVEFDTSGKLIVINQDDTYAKISEASGATFTFKSVSSELDAAVALNDQLDHVPGGIQITVDVKIDGIIYNNRVAWNYSNKCGKYPIADMEGVGWVSLHHHVQAAPAFCDVTSAPVATPVITDVTSAPLATSVTTDAPVATPVTTDAPNMSMSISMSMYGKAGKVAKSAKAKGSKDGGSMR